ncbi:MAG: DUF29 domain-containing protein [Methylococcaceae bacterium]|nr:MAG: DUF29 domain-containing protein [Methylococcaceae bacterium]
MTTIAYEFDVIAWAQEQAALLRSGQFNLLDIEHIADEIEDVGKSEQRELENRMAVLLAHLLKWQYQSERRGNSWRRTIIDQRQGIARRLLRTPSLKASLRDLGWWADAWQDARQLASSETRIDYDCFPETCSWTFDQIMDSDFWPSHE